ncbi:P2Y purinoceptor 1-like [Carcharodon carcharias]|uniref:P2Y purinoceptor 1-like n=1 Tax=Carcharodon carcharias TaxID=13397 RepID=UPI001B7DA087|nr:P2Y purinoceptor 1-like [Carcharodon carcharias]
MAGSKIMFVNVDVIKIDKVLESVFCNLHQDQTLFFIQIYVIPVAFLLVLVIGLTMNCLALWVMVHQTKPWNRSTLFLCNLTVADITWMLTLPFLIHYHFARLQWVFGDIVCKIVRCAYHACFYSSIYFVTCISLDRYLAIVHPLQSFFLLSRQQSLYVCVGIWVLTCIVSIPSALITFIVPCSQNQTVCTFYIFSYNTDKTLPYTTISTVTGFILPFVAICYCYWNCTKELKKHCSQKKKLFRLMYSVLIIFGLIYLPYHLLRNACIVLRAFWSNHTWLAYSLDVGFSVEMAICSFNTCVNPFFYFITSGNGKNSLRKTFSNCCRETKQQVRFKVAAVHPV